MRPVRQRAIEYFIWCTHDRVLTCCGVMIFIFLGVAHYLSVPLSGKVIAGSFVGVLLMFMVCEPLRDLLMAKYGERVLRDPPPRFDAFWKYVFMVEVLYLVAVPLLGLFVWLMGR